MFFVPSTDCARASSCARVVSLPTRLAALGRCAAQLNPLVPSTRAGSVTASVSVITPGFQMAMSALPVPIDDDPVRICSPVLAKTVNSVRRWICVSPAGP